VLHPDDHLVGIAAGAEQVGNVDVLKTCAVLGAWTKSRTRADQTNLKFKAGRHHTHDSETKHETLPLMLKISIQWPTGPLPFETVSELN
jgi:hypothetical protein